MIYGFGEVDVELGVKSAELSPNFRVKPLAGCTYHDGGSPLPRIAVRPNPVLSADGDKQPYGPGVRKRELHLDCGLRMLPQPLLNSSDRRLGSGALAVGAGTTEQCLKLGKTCWQIVIINRQIEPPDSRPTSKRYAHGIRHATTYFRRQGLPRAAVPCRRRISQEVAEDSRS